MAKVQVAVQDSQAREVNVVEDKTFDASVGLDSSATNSSAHRRVGKSTVAKKAKGNLGINVMANPFENNVELTPYEFTKRLFVGFTLFPLRILIAIPTLLFLWLFAGLAILGGPLECDRGCHRHTKPYAAWRGIFLYPMVFCIRIALWVFGIWWIRVLDDREDKSWTPNIIVVGPHTTILDMFVMMVVFPRSGFLGQVPGLKIPIQRQISIATQGVYIDISDKDSKHSAKDAIALRASPNWKGAPMSIWPEGTITNGKQLVQFKAGAFSAGEPVLPVLLTFPFEHYDPSWCGRNRSPLWAIRNMLQIVTHCEVEIMDPYIPDAEEKANGIKFANNCRKVMSDMIGLPTTEHSYDDVFFYQEAFFGANVGNDFEVKSMKKLFNCDMTQLKEWLELFKKADKGNTGHLTRDELAAILKLEGAEKKKANRLFKFFDVDDSGTIEYREFVQILAVLGGSASNESMAKLAFEVYDTKGQGAIKKSELVKALGKNVLHIRSAEKMRKTAVARKSMANRSSTASTASERERRTRAPGIGVAEGERSSGTSSNSSGTKSQASNREKSTGGVQFGGVQEEVIEISTRENDEAEVMAQVRNLLQMEDDEEEEVPAMVQWMWGDDEEAGMVAGKVLDVLAKTNAVGKYRWSKSMSFGDAISSLTSSSRPEDQGRPVKIRRVFEDGKKMTEPEMLDTVADAKVHLKNLDEEMFLRGAEGERSTRVTRKSNADELITFAQFSKMLEDNPELLRAAIGGLQEAADEFSGKPKIDPEEEETFV